MVMQWDITKQGNLSDLKIHNFFVSKPHLF